jgi:group I intron endonuclease
MIIYSYLNKHTNKRYIGQTINPDQRKRNHLHEATKNNSQYYFHRSIRKYGWDSFIYEVLEEVEDRSLLDERENYYIEKYNTIWPNGYNQCIANSLDETAIEKMRQTKINRYENMTEEEKRLLVEPMVQANLGRKHSEETNRKRSESLKKYLKENPRVISEERKRKTSITVSQQKWCNDGVRNYRLKEIPEGFKKGKIKKRGP